MTLLRPIVYRPSLPSFSAGTWRKAVPLLLGAVIHPVISAQMPAEGSAPTTEPSAAATQADFADANFDARLLRGMGGQTIDVSRFEHGNPLIPGAYRADVYVNQKPDWPRRYQYWCRDGWRR